MAHNDEGRSPNYGKEVTTVFLYLEKAGVEQENVWRCCAKEGEALITYHGGLGPEADFLECWLEIAEQPAETKVLEKELEQDGN